MATEILSFSYAHITIKDDIMDFADQIVCSSGFSQTLSNCISSLCHL